MNEIEIVFRRDLGGTEVTFATNGVPSEAVNPMADVLAAATDRQFAKQVLRETLVDWLATRKSLDDHDGRVRKYVTERAGQRAEILAAFHANHPATKRSDFAPTKAQQTQIAGFDAETVQKLKELSDAKQRLHDALPELDGKIERLKLRIGGADMIDMLEAERDALMRPLAEAAD